MRARNSLVSPATADATPRSSRLTQPASGTILESMWKIRRPKPEIRIGRPPRGGLARGWRAGAAAEAAEPDSFGLRLSDSFRILGVGFRALTMILFRSK